MLTATFPPPLPSGLQFAPTDPHVKVAILQMLGNSYGLATAQPETAAACFATIEAIADQLLDRGPATLHAHAIKHGMARDIGPAELHDAPTTQQGVLELLEPWFADEIKAALDAAGVDDVTTDEAMLAVLCVFGHVVTAHLKKTHPKLAAKLGLLLWADAKTADRMRIKWLTEYARHFGGLLDFVRFSLTCPDQTAQEKFLAPMLPRKNGKSKSKFTVRRVKSTHADRKAQVKQCLVNLEWAPGMKFGKLLTKNALAAAFEAAPKANLGMSEVAWNIASTVLRDGRLAKQPVRMILEVQLYASVTTITTEPIFCASPAGSTTIISETMLHSC